MRRGAHFCALVSILSLAALLHGKPSFAQSQGTVPPAAGKGAAAPEDAATLQSMMDADEEAVSGAGYTYDPRGRRDPFRSLLQGSRQGEGGPRPEGIPGLLIEEIDLQGIWRSKQGLVAQVRSSDNKSYLLKAGDKLFNGEVILVDKTKVVFKQIVNDPLAVKPFQEVVKELASGKG